MFPMRTILLPVFFLASALCCRGQCLQCKYCDTVHLKVFPRDLYQLYHYIDDLRTNALIPFKILFDSCHEKGNSQSLNQRLEYLADTTAIMIEQNIYSIKHDTLYPRDANKDMSCLYFYTNKELEDYLAGLRFVQSLLGNLFDRGGKECVLNEFNNINLLSAYYSMFESRSLLLSAMDNLDHYIALKDTLGTQTNMIALGIDSAHRAEQRAETHLTKIQDKVYKDLPMQLNSMQTDIKENARKQSAIWGVIGGLIGGVVAGLIVHSFK
jgi:hypothetical protein